MRVSHSWTPKLHILEIFDLHRRPVDRQPSRMDFIFPVRTLRSRTCPLGKYEGMDMHRWSTVVCKIWGQFRWNLVIYGCRMSYSEGGPSNGQISKRLIDTGRNHSGSIPMWSGDLQLQGLTLCGSVTAGRHNSIFLKLYNIFDLHRSPVDRQPLMIWTLCFRCLPCLPLPSNAVNMKAWTCTA